MLEPVFIWCFLLLNIIGFVDILSGHCYPWIIWDICLACPPSDWNDFLCCLFVGLDKSVEPVAVSSSLSRDWNLLRTSMVYFFWRLLPVLCSFQSSWSWCFFPGGVMLFLRLSLILTDIILWSDPTLSKVLYASALSKPFFHFLRTRM